MKDVLLPVLVGMAGALLINMFYSVAKVRWPESYFATSQILDRSISSSWLKYSIFRLVPPYSIGVLTGAVAIRYHVSVGWTLFVCGSVHLTSTVGRALLLGIRKRSLKARLVIAYIGVMVMAAFAIWFAERTTYWWFPHTPGPDKYVEVALTGLVAAVAIHYLQRMTQQSPNLDQLVSAFRKRMPPDLFRHLVTECARNAVDYDLAYAILITEATQRPRWIRSMERVAGAARLSTTHGIMQSSRDWRVSDETSISEAIINLSGAAIRRRNGHPREVEIKYHLERHNKGREFSEFATEVFWALHNRYVGVSSYLGADGSPGLRVLERRREGGQWRIEGDVSLEIGLVVVVEDAAKVNVLAVTSATGANEFLRRTWQVKVSISLDSIVVLGLDKSHLATSVETQADIPVASTVAGKSPCMVKIYL